LTPSYKCVKLPPHCIEVTESGVCTKCAKDYILDHKGVCCPKVVSVPDKKPCDHK